MQPQRRSYSKSFKAQVVQVVQECLSFDVSIARIALRHRINANLVRKWITIYRDLQASALPAFIPLKLETAGRLRRPSSEVWPAFHRKLR